MPCSTAAGLAHNGPPIRRLADSIAGRTLARLIGMVDSAFARDDVMAFLASVPIRRPGGHPVPVDRWDLISRRAGVVDGDHWDDPPRALRRRHGDPRSRCAHRARRRPVDDAAPDAPRPGSVAHAAVELAEFVAALRARLADFAAATGWRDRAERAQAALQATLVDARARRRWPEAERDAFDAVLGALERLADLESVEDAPAPGAFARAVDAELAAPFGRVGRFGEGVLCAPIGAAIGLDLDAVVVVGLAEGLCPVPRREDALLADRDRRLAVDGELAVREAALQDQRRGYLAALASGATHRILERAARRSADGARAVAVAVPARDRDRADRPPGLRERLRQADRRPTGSTRSRRSRPGCNASTPRPASSSTTSV